METLEDIYLPFKLKRKTKAAKAKESGLEPLAQKIWDWGHGTAKPAPGDTLEALAEHYVSKEKGVKDLASALQGAQDILIEKLSEAPELRQFVREYSFKNGYILSEKGSKSLLHSKYEKYFNFEEKITSLLLPQNSHRYLAIKRGWNEEELKINIGGAKINNQYDAELLKRIENAACTQPASPGSALLLKAAKLSLKAHIQTSIDSEIHAALKEVADEAAITVFAENVRKLLLSAPFGSQAVLGVDPGIRTGCKIAIVNDAGKYIASTVMFTQSAAEKSQSAQMLQKILSTQNIRAIAVGNGTAGRETESFLRTTLKTLGFSTVPVVMVNESGASVYSASEVAREEFPDLDLTVRGAISIARRLQDPLAELVKVDPKSIGVGQYQHDVSPTQLKKNLDQVVDSCVNGVGVNLNTASYHLLSRVSGIGHGLAKSIVEYREKKGVFKSRQDLLEVPRFSKKSFELSAGFLRVAGGLNPLDNTGIHPERYEVLENIAQDQKKKISDLLGNGVEILKKQKALRERVGAFTYDDIIKELEKPGRDPREGFSAFQFREDIHEVKDLEAGMICPGLVTNVTNFGAFVDIGVHQDGLVHISQLSDSFVKDPRTVVSPGDKVHVRVVEVNLEKNQIALTMKKELSKTGAPRAAPSTSPKTPPTQDKLTNNAFASLSSLKIKR